MSYTTLICNARIIDGTGNPWIYGDVALAGDRIAAIAPPGSIPAENAAEVVDASGLVVCPGFIDIQSHAILPLMVDGRCLSKITQGITTEIMGEAWTPAPVGGRNTDPLQNTLFVLHISDEWKERIQSWARFGDLAHGDGSPRRFAQHRLVHRRRHHPRLCPGHGNGPAQRRRAGDHAPHHRRGHGRRRVWRLLCADLPA